MNWDLKPELAETFSPLLRAWRSFSSLAHLGAAKMEEVSPQVPPRCAQEMKLVRDSLSLVGSADAQSSGRGRGQQGREERGRWAQGP